MLLPLVSTVTSSGATAVPVERASIVTCFCCSSDAMTLTRPSRFLTTSETFWGASISDLYPWANAERHNPTSRIDSWARRLNDIADRSCPPERERSSGEQSKEFHAKAQRGRKDAKRTMNFPLRLSLRLCVNPFF